MARPAWAAVAGAGLGLLALAAADRGGTTAHVAADGRFDRRAFRGFSDSEPGAGRVARVDSVLVLDGLWSSAPVTGSVTMASALPRAQVVTVYANGAAAGRQDVGGRFGVLDFRARTDAQGSLQLRFAGPDPATSAVRVREVTVARAGRGEVPRTRWLLYAGFVALAATLALALRGGRAAGLAVAAGPGVVLAAAIARSRLLALDHLALLVVALALALAAYAVSRRLGMPATSAWWLGAALALRAFLGLHPAFPSVDLGFHLHRLEAFRSGQQVTSHVASPSGEGTLAIPYPPLLYAALAPLASSPERGESALRIVMLVLEGSVPWVLFGLVRAGRGSARAAAGAAVAAAVMPEGLLVLAKGIAANIAGAWLSLLAVWVLLARAPAFLLAVPAAAAFLAHPGAAASLALLLVTAAAWELRAGRLTAPRAGTIVVAVAGAGLLAWLAYYREVATVTGASLAALRGQALERPGVFFAFRGVHVAKAAQNLLLKMGGGPVVAAVRGLGTSGDDRLRALLACWLAVGALLGLLAVVTPLAFRFEYFMAPAVAIAAGLGAEAWSGQGRGRRVTALWGLSFALQCAIGLLLLLGRFELISVIIPSPRWGWPFRVT